MEVKRQHRRLGLLIKSHGQSAGIKTLPLFGVVVAILVGLSKMVAAQALPPPIASSSGANLGATGGTPAKMPLFSSGQNATTQVHVGPNNRPCLTFLGYAQQQKINPNMFSHMILVSNECGQRIKIQLCYYQTQHCTSITVPLYGREEAILGVMPAMKDFRFEYREQFDQNSVFGGAGGTGVGIRPALLGSPN